MAGARAETAHRVRRRPHARGSARVGSAGDAGGRGARAHHTGVKKVYVALFAEAKHFPHIHFHLIPRPARLPTRLRGPLIFELMRTDRDRAPIGEAERIAERMRRALR